MVGIWEWNKFLTRSPTLLYMYMSVPLMFVSSYYRPRPCSWLVSLKIVWCVLYSLWENKSQTLKLTMDQQTVFLEVKSFQTKTCKMMRLDKNMVAARNMRTKKSEWGFWLKLYFVSLMWMRIDDNSKINRKGLSAKGVYF